MDRVDGEEESGGTSDMGRGHARATEIGVGRPIATVGAADAHAGRHHADPAEAESSIATVWSKVAILVSSSAIFPSISWFCLAIIVF